MPLFNTRGLAGALAIALGVVGTGCSSSSGGAVEADAGPATPATLTQVWAIMSGTKEGDCFGCHGPSNTGGPAAGLNMSTQALMYADTVGKPPTTNTLNTCAAVGMTDGLDIVKAGDAAHSLLYLKISETPPPCGVHMPKNRSPLTAAEIATFESWINAGALND